MPDTAAQDDPPVVPVESAWAVAPDDEAVTVGRPVFALGFAGVEPADTRLLRFKIELRAADDHGPDYVFDQRQSRSGWLPGDVGEVQFRPPRPLADGSYRWEGAVWDGIAWHGAGPPRRIRIDSVAPAWVDTLRVRFDADPANGGRVHLSWQPVTADLAGGPEYVTRYHVFRFELGPHQPMVRPFRIGVAEAPSFVDELPPADRAILFYRVAAEDQAGNVTGIRQ